MSEKIKDIIFYVTAGLFLLAVLISAVLGAIGISSLALSIITAVLMIAFITVATIFRFKYKKPEEKDEETTEK